MRTTNFVALAVGLLLTAAAFLGIYYDARHGVALHRSEVTAACGPQKSGLWVLKRFGFASVA
jgi:hypothetical protein